MPAFMEFESSLSLSQKPATGPYSEPNAYTTHPHTLNHRHHSLSNNLTKGHRLVAPECQQHAVQSR